HVLEDGHFAGAELVGQLLHGRRVTMQMPVIANGHEYVGLTGSKIHNASLKKRRRATEPSQPRGPEYVRSMFKQNITLTLPLRQGFLQKKEGGPRFSTPILHLYVAAACKPNSVSVSTTRHCKGVNPWNPRRFRRRRSFLWGARCRASQATYPRIGRP